jgi:hypothetical protein
MNKEQLAKNWANGDLKEYYAFLAGFDAATRPDTKKITTMIPEQLATQHLQKIKEQYEITDTVFVYEAYLAGYGNGHLDGYMKATTWIKVTEKLPEENQRVLIAEGEYVGIASYCKFNRTDKHLSFCDDQDEQPGIYHATHWQPLPTPPTE